MDPDVPKGTQSEEEKRQLVQGQMGKSLQLLSRLGPVLIVAQYLTDTEQSSSASTPAINFVLQIDSSLVLPYMF